ncbi:MAG: copper resistance protein CopC [Actinobacteria bacterium 13_1_20CM_3_71_11]|nr:MAG: copper resistance protein CopC [Actinobacteria bacterium 13_1_20CM_3_71_11]
MTPYRIGLALLLGLLGLFALPASPASAHAALVRTSPVQGTVLQQAPYEIVVTFSEHVTPVRDKINVVGPDGKRVDQSTATVSGADLHIPVRTNVPRGTYLVSYRVISADAHPLGAGFTYSVGAPSATAPLPGSATSGRTDRTVAISLASAKYLSYAGLILVAGPVLVLTALWPHRLPRRDPARLGYLGLGLVGLSTLLELYLQAPYENGGTLFSASGSDLSAILNSTFGRAHVVRLVVVAIGALLLPLFLNRRGGRPVKAVLAVAGVLGIATWGLAGHPAASNAPVLTEIADAAHLTSMAIWLGGLVMLVLFVLRRATSEELGAILPVWSNWAALAVTVLILAGTAQGLIEVVTYRALVSTTYGQLLLVKIALLGGVLTAAYFSRRLVQRPKEPHRLRRSVLVEIIGAVLILGFASALVQTTPARTAAATVPAQTPDRGVFSTTLNTKLYQLQLDIEPTKVGNNEVHLYAYTPVGAPLAVKEWKVSAALPAGGIEPIDVPTLPLTESHATGTITLPSAGNWQFNFTLRISDFDEATVSTAVQVT